jgi:4-hydroxy-3-polyprenylbenzoate decarboxylase
MNESRDMTAGKAARPAPRVVVALTGASGAIYGLRLLRFLLVSGARVEAVISPSGQRVLREEADYGGESLGEYLDRLYPADRAALAAGSLAVHHWGDIGAPLASGSVPTSGMIVAPCSMGTLAGIVCGRASNLIERAADVTLKEGRPLILIPRETPFNRIHVENMLRAVDAGIRIVPAMPAFYFGPRTFEDLADFVVARAVAFLGLEAHLYRPWAE